MTELKEYIRKSLEEGQQNQDESRQGRINFFKEKVEELYRLVNDRLLADLREEGLFSVSYEDEDIVEEGLGKYNTRSMLMKMGYRSSWACRYVGERWRRECDSYFSSGKYGWSPDTYCWYRT